MDGPLLLPSGGTTLNEIIVVRVTDPDGSLFQAIMDALKDKRTEIIHVTAPFSTVLRIGELEIYHEHRRVLMAGREVRLNHGEYAMLSCMAKRPGRIYTKEQLYAAAWDETYPYGSSAVENTIYRLRKKLEPDPRNPVYFKTVIRAGYKIEIPEKPGQQGDDCTQ